jgi:acyl carrier protein
MKLNFDTFIQLFSEEISLDVSSLSPSDKFRNLSTWGSLNALLLISRVNEEYDVFITSSDLSNCQTIEDIFNAVKSRQHDFKG